MIETRMPIGPFATLLGRQALAPALGSAGVVCGLLAQGLEGATLRHDQMPPVGGLLAVLQAGGPEQIG